MPTESELDALVSTTLPAAPALPPAPALPAASASSEPPLADDSTASEPDLDIPPLDPIIDPIAHRRAEVERLGERIAELSSRIQAATYDLLVLIREFDAQIGWSGWTSCAHWLSWRTGLAPGAAREHVRVARALGNLPKLSDAMRRGAVSYSKARAVTRVATPETEQALLDVAQSGTAAHVEQIVRGWRRVDRTAERTEEKRRQDRRSLRTWVDDDGMVVVQGRLTPEVGAALRRALEAACDKAQARRALAARDGQCRFPGCGNRRCDAHHVRHWADGGETALDNLVLLCRRHHRAVHEEGFRITLDAASDVQFTRPDGRPFPATPPPPAWSGAPLAPTNDRLDEEGIEVDSQAAAPAWKGERVDIGWAVGLLWKPRPDAPSAHTHS